MTKAEAQELCSRLGREHEDRQTHRWLPRPDGDGWSVVKVPVPTGMSRDELRPTVEAKPRPPQPDDPRPGHDRQVGGPWAL